ncbi:MAG: hypothetical protein HY252_17025 [Sphingobacteriales bacterium]|nr:hypothetical protein [Sphingobacteriales bacterium]
MNKNRWIGIAAVIIATVIYRTYSENKFKTDMERIRNSRNFKEEQKNKMFDYINDKSVFYNMDSIVALIKKDKEQYYLTNVAFNSKDSSLMLFVDSSRQFSDGHMDTLFAGLCIKYNIEFAKNVTSVIAYKTFSIKQANENSFVPKVLWTLFRKGSSAEKEVKQLNNISN